ncbi:hypothetical protein F2Q70_00037333 [Brassica cretica]|uniref:Uncharacterized protein n=1 Tax=Brassica cretica TaxID=69181 RepID=A0A3N6QDX7_BRACR|nr:hypothetical protein F2Q70_00037333 [Brassica cretica]KAF3532224.1 hypothetical protein DY000_02043081 [Brassica cretica]
MFTVSSRFENLATLNHKEFQDTRALKTMEINGCEKLRISVDEELSPSLSCIRIRRSCSLLTKKLAEEEIEFLKVLNFHMWKWTARFLKAEAR